MPAKLYLLPNVLDEELSVQLFLPVSVHEAVRSIQGLIAESEKAARRYLRKFLSHEEMVRMPLALLNEHVRGVEELLLPIERGEIWGLISDGGLPCIADPGADLVWLARKRGLVVETFVGPTSIVMALQLSGFGGQQFSFHGYLPKDLGELKKKIRELEGESGTKIWIETPYRSQRMLEVLKEILHPSTRLCAAISLTTSRERVVSKTVTQWRENSFRIDKEPVVFLIA